MSDSAPSAPTRGRIDKRAAIISAAIDVFSTEGFTRASLDRIAAKAAVSKPTIYSHFGDKESLFRSVMYDSVDLSARKIISAISGDADVGVDVREQLIRLGIEIVTCQLSEEGWALQRLLYAESDRFPDLYADVVLRGGPPVLNALAGRLALLTAQGHLTVADPTLAANHFLSLTTGNLPALSALGRRTVPAKVLRDEISAAVSTFLLAFGMRPTGDVGVVEAGQKVAGPRTARSPRSTRASR